MTHEDQSSPGNVPDPNQAPLFPPPWPTASSQPTQPAPAVAPRPWPDPTTSTSSPSRKRRAPMVLALVAVVALLAGGAGAAVGVAVSQRSSTSPSTSSFVPPGFDGSGGGTSGNGSLGNGLDTPSDSQSGSNVGVDVDAIARKVNPAIVNISTELSGGQQAAGSGMVLTSNGEVLTNNHVINGATKIEVEIGVTGKTYSAKVLGYDVEDDVALIKLNNASGMQTISTAAASSVSRNDAVVAIGNALGRFGTPAAVAGTVSALHQKVTAGDGTDQETLEDMIRIAASIQPGDSGGALLNDQGKVIGMNTAADAGAGQYGYQSGTTGFAIPIGNALKIVDEIKDGDTSNGAHIGDRALLGVVLQDASSDSPFGGGSGANGAPVADVGSGTPAEDAGMASGDTITSIDKHSVGSIDDLRSVLDTHHPGDKVSIEWVDESGESHRATVTLTKGPPA